LTITERHLSDEAILLLTTGELREAEVANAHLAGCVGCRQRLERQLRLRRQLGVVFKSQQLFSTIHAPERVMNSRAFRVAISTATIVSVLAVWLGSRNQLNAAEVLDRAVRAEVQVRRRSGGNRVRLQAVRSACSVQLGAFEPARRECAAVKSAIAAVKWTWDDPLSARAFKTWRDTLSKPKDRVERASDAIRITTSTSAGPLRTARLTMASGNYQPQALELEIANVDTIRITELPEVPPAAIAETPLREQPAVASPHSPAVAVPHDDPLDTAEVAAWEFMERAGLLSAWRGSVRRTASTVEILALVESAENRSALLEQLPKAAGLKPLIFAFGEDISEDLRFSPDREHSSGLPALGAKWVGERLPAGRSVSAFNNEVADRSRQVLGLATTRQRILDAQSRVAGCSCAGRLHEVAERTEQALLGKEDALATALLPIFRDRTRPPALLSEEEARALDARLIWILFSSSPNAGNLADELGGVGVVLGLDPLPVEEESVFDAPKN
jgi:hypothetical protein